MTDYSPMLAEPCEKRFENLHDVILIGEKLEKAGFVFQIKYDGERALAYIKSGNVRLMSRRNIDVAHRFPKIVAELAKLPDCVLDGEIVALNEQGVADFGKLSLISHLDNKEKIFQLNDALPTAFMVFDILELNGKYVGSTQYENRRHILWDIFHRGEQTGIVRHVTDYSDFQIAWHNTEAVEGLIAKRLNSPYYQSRNSAWLKLKKWQEEIIEFTGYEEHENRAGITLTNPQGDRCSVGSQELAEKIKAMLEKPKYRIYSAKPDKARQAIEAVMNKPLTVKAEVQHLGRNADGRMRFPSFKRLVE